MTPEERRGLDNGYALRLLEEWQSRDPGARKFKVTYNGPIKRTPLTWSGGYSVRLTSSRIKRKRCPAQLTYAGISLEQAVARALKAYKQHTK